MRTHRRIAESRVEIELPRFPTKSARTPPRYLLFTLITTLPPKLKFLGIFLAGSLCRHGESSYAI